MRIDRSATDECSCCAMVPAAGKLAEQEPVVVCFYDERQIVSSLTTFSRLLFCLMWVHWLCGEPVLS
jgi:hypothetical protein